jgi:NaMN:DMB phosphoribosyltransferase
MDRLVQEALRAREVRPGLRAPEELRAQVGGPDQVALAVRIKDLRAFLP